MNVGQLLDCYEEGLEARRAFYQGMIRALYAVEKLTQGLPDDIGDGSELWPQSDTDEEWRKVAQCCFDRVEEDINRLHEGGVAA